MQEKRGILGGEKDNMVKSQPKKEDKYNRLFNPIIYQIGFSKPPKIIYYELRIWKNHNIISIHVFTTLKEAIKYYKRYNLSIKEDENQCFVEIIKVENLNPRYK